MFRCNVFSLTLCLAAIFTLPSCGSQSAGGGTGEFTTVMMTAQPAIPRLESDVLSGNTCPTSATSGGTYSTDFVDVDLKSTAYQGISVTPLPVRVSAVTVTYTPKSPVSPAIPAQPWPLGAIVNSGSTTTVSIPVAPEILKTKLVSDYNLQLCSTSLYEYYVTLTFTGVEIGGTGTAHQFSTNLDIAFADRAGTQ